MNYTKEQYEILKKYDGYLYTSCYAGFVRLADRNSLLELEKIYKEKFGESSGILGGCNRCIMNGLKKLGLKYFEDKKIYTAMENKEAEATEPKTTKRRGRKPSNKNTTNDGTE